VRILVGAISDIKDYYKSLNVKIEKGKYEKIYHTGIKFGQILFLYHLLTVTPLLIFITPISIFLFIISLNISFLLPISILLTLIVLLFTFISLIIYIEQRKECLTLIRGNELRIISKVDFFLPYVDVTIPIKNIKHIEKNQEIEGKVKGFNVWKRKRSKILSSSGQIYPIYSLKKDLITIKLFKPIEIKVTKNNYSFSKLINVSTSKLVINLNSNDQNSFFQSIKNKYSNMNFSLDKGVGTD
jgi:hypothetical protein